MEERTLKSERLYEGRVISLDLETVELPDGRISTREIVRHHGAVGVIAVRPDGQCVFVRQFRKALERITLEIVAGGIDPGETIDTCARREMLEETGYKVTRLEPLGALYPAPGYTTERIDIFYAEVASESDDPSPDDDEFVEVVTMKPAAFGELIANRKIQDAKSLGGWLMFEKSEFYPREPGA